MYIILLKIYIKTLCCWLCIYSSLNVASLLSSLFHGIPVYSMAFHSLILSESQIPWIYTAKILLYPMEFHGIPQHSTWGHRIPLNFHGNSIETIDTMAIFCIPWNSMAFHSIPPGCHRIPLKCHGNLHGNHRNYGNIRDGQCAEATFGVLQMIGWEVLCKIVCNFYSPISPLFLICCHLHTFNHVCTLFTILQLFITLSRSVTMFMTSYHVWPLSPLYQHFNTVWIFSSTTFHFNFANNIACCLLLLPLFAAFTIFC